MSQGYPRETFSQVIIGIKKQRFFRETDGRIAICLFALPKKLKHLVCLGKNVVQQNSEGME
ncbi:hypothetical protein CHH70_01195 [Shouchella clausii]|nr:hypothetical protein CHH70_01195 [Shouchella clausii]